MGIHADPIGAGWRRIFDGGWLKANKGKIIDLFLKIQRPTSGADYVPAGLEPTTPQPQPPQPPPQEPVDPCCGHLKGGYKKRYKTQKRKRKTRKGGYKRRIYKSRNYQKKKKTRRRHKSKHN